MSVARSQELCWRSLIPNGLTVGRLIAGLLFPFWGPGARLALLLYAGLSDLVDGEISRKLGATTRLGQILDPIADKTVILAVAGTFLWEGSIAWWELLLVAMRDLVVLAISVAAMFRRWNHPMETSPLVIGKIATGAQFVYLLTVLLPLAYPFAFVVAAVLSCTAAIAYLGDAINQMRNLSSA